MDKLRFALLVLVMSMTTLPSKADGHSVIATDDIEWGLLNPLRGEASPRAADLWGDLTKDMATGMSVKFNKGFSSPPHIHNITYRGVVIEGLMHNDDPSAEKMWLPTGVELQLKLTQVLHLKVTHLESQTMAHLPFGFLVLVSFVSFIELCLKR